MVTFLLCLYEKNVLTNLVIVTIVKSIQSQITIYRHYNKTVQKVKGFDEKQLILSQFKVSIFHKSFNYAISADSVFVDKNFKKKTVTMDCSLCI